MLRWLRLGWLGAPLMAALSCSGNEDGERPVEQPVDAGHEQEAQAPSPLQVEVIENPSNVLSYYVQWRTPEAAQTHLEVDCGAEYHERFESAALSIEHEVFVMGLLSGLPCTMTARAGELEGTASIEVAKLPDFLPELSVVEHRDADMQTGWTLFNLTKNYDDPPPVGAAIVDEQARFRWYHQRAVTNPGEDTDTRVVDEGVLIGGTWKVMAGLVDWEGSLLWEADFVMHHHIEPYGAPGQWIFLTQSPDGCPMGYGAGVINHYDWHTGQMLWQWRLCDHYTPPSVVYDWSHTNTIEPVPGENALLLSSRNQDQIFKIDVDTGDIVWGFGKGGDFALPAEDEFLRQHDPELLPNGNILLYDNGVSDLREWSRAIEYEIDTVNMTARAVWQFRPTPDIFTPIWGDADRLDNGNTLMVFGRRSPAEDSHFIEVLPTGTEVWHVHTPPGWGLYRAQRITTLPKGYVKAVE